MLHDESAGEGRRSLGQAVRACKVGEELIDVKQGEWQGSMPVEARPDRLLVELVGSGSFAPGVDERVGVNSVILRASRGQGGSLASACRRVAGLGEHLSDLVPALAEIIDGRLGDSHDVGKTVDDRRPLDPQPLGQEVAEMSLVEVAARQGMVEQEPPLQRSPRTVHRERDVHDDDVGVQQRVAGAAGAVVESGSHHPGRLDAIASEPSQDRLALVVANDVVDRLPVCLADDCPPVGIGQRPQDAHALGGPEG